MREDRTSTGASREGSRSEMFAERLVDGSPVAGRGSREAAVERKPSPGERGQDGPMPGRRAEVESIREGVVVVLVVTIYNPYFVLRLRPRCFTQRPLSLLITVLGGRHYNLPSVSRGTGSSTYTHPPSPRYQNPPHSSPFCKMVYYLHITYSHRLLYFKSSLDYLSYLI